MERNNDGNYELHPQPFFITPSPIRFYRPTLGAEKDSYLLSTKIEVADIKQKCGDAVRKYFSK